MKATPLIIAAATAGLLALGAAPANAAGNTIADGDSLYAINCDSGFDLWQLFSVDSSTAASTPVGTGEPITQACAGQAAYDPSTGMSYYIQWSEGTQLASIDVATGVSTTIGDFYWPNGEFPEDIDADALAIGGDGSAYILDDADVYSVNLENGFVEFVASLDDDLDSIYAFAWDSVTDAFYGISYDNFVYQIGVTDGSYTEIGTITFPDVVDEVRHFTYSLQFDHEGTLWVEVDRQADDFAGTLFSVTFDTLATPVYSGEFLVGETEMYTESLLVIPGVAPAPVPAPEPALAATGADLASVLPWGIGAGVIVLAGGVLLILRSRRKPATTASVSGSPEIEQKN